MRVLLHSPDATWVLAWGVQLIGTDPECEIRLPPESSAAPVAGVLVRWLEHCMVLSVGDQPGLAIDGDPVMKRRIDLGDLPRNDLGTSREEAVGIPLTAGGIKLLLVAEDVPSPARADEFSPADFEAVMRAAMAHSLKAGAPGGGDAALLPELVRRMTHADVARFAQPDEGAPPGQTAMLTLLPDASRSALQSVRLEWATVRPADFRPERAAASISYTLADALAAVASGKSGPADPPAYSDGTIGTKQMRQSIGAYTLLGPEDFEHLGLEDGRVRKPQTLVSSIHGQLDVVDLSSAPELEVNGRRVRRARGGRENRVEVCGVEVHLELGEPTPLTIPARIFRHLALWADPVTQIARLGLLLPHLTGRTEQRLAYLVAAVAGTRATGVVAGAVGADGHRRTSPAVVRWLGSALTQESFESCHLFEKALLKSRSEDGTFVSPDARADLALAPQGFVPPDMVAPYWGPLAVLTHGVLSLTVWRTPNEGRFHQAEIAFLKALLAGLATDGLLPPADLVPEARVAHRPAPPSTAVLVAGNVHLPLGDVTVVGRHRTADVQLPWDSSMSPRHALVLRDEARYRVYDLRSFHGVKLDGKQVSEAHLVPGTDLVLGSTRLYFQHAGPSLIEEKDAGCLPEDREIEPDRVRTEELARCMILGRELARVDDPEAGARQICEAGGVLVDRALYLVEVDDAGELVAAKHEEPPPIPRSVLRRCRRLIARAVDSGEVQGLVTAPLVVVPAPALSRKRGLRRALVFQPGELTGPELMRRVGLLATLTGVPAPPPAVPTIRSAGRTVPVAGPVWIGRSRECQLVLEAAAVSRKHALIVPGHGSPPFLWAVDFLSDKGMSLRGKSVERAKLYDGDRLRIASYDIEISIPRGAAPTPPTGILARAPALVELGRAATDLPRFAALLRGTLDAARVVVVGADGPLANDCNPDLGPPDSALSFLGQFEVDRLVHWLRSSGRPTVRTLDPTRIYRQAAMASIAFIRPLTERSCLGVPFSYDGSDPRLLLIASLRPADVAFRQADLDLAAAAVRLLGP